MPTLTVIMQVANAVEKTPGEAIFRRALESVMWADELVVVDGESRDRTRDIAAEFNARIFSLPPEPDFVAPKLLALDHATGDWVLWLDSDEVAPPALRLEIEAAIAAPTADGYRIVRDHIFAGRALSHCSRDYPLRLWRRGCGAFAPPRIHEYYEVPGPQPVLPTPMLHYSTTTLRSRMVKMVELGVNQSTDSADFPPGDGWLYAWHYLLKPPLGAFKNIFFTQRGYKDGLPGLVWAMMNAITRLYMQLLIWERGLPRP